MTIRKANRKDVPGIVALLANDSLGKTRESFQNPVPTTYYDAFERIQADSNHELVIMENNESQVIGTLQLTFLQYLTYQGGIRAQIEAVRVHEDYRGRGIGQELFQWAIARAKEKGAHVVQLTTDKKRPEALKFYTALGFQATHEGMKLHL